MAKPVPPGIDPILWNLAILVAAIQQLQTQAQPITPQQVTALSALLTTSPALGIAQQIIKPSAVAKAQS